jgi:flagellar motor switch protein FliM
MAATPEETAAAAAEAATAPEAAEASGPVISDEEASALLEKNGSGGVRPYDMLANRINRMRLPNLEYVAKIYATRAASAIGNLLGREAAVKFDALDRGKCGDLLAAMPNPASIAVLRLKPLPGHALLSLDPRLLLALLDGFFGGAGKVSADPMAAASSAAQRFFGLLLRTLAPEFNAAWAPIAPLEVELVKQEHDARFVQIGAAQDALVMVRFVVEFCGTSGSLDWLLPESQVAPVREALAADGSAEKTQLQQPWAPVLSTALQAAQIETRAVLGQAQISLRELVQLSPGDVIPIEAPEAVVLMAEDVPLYHGRFGVSQGHNAVKILNGAVST